MDSSSGELHREIKAAQALKLSYFEGLLHFSLAMPWSQQVIEFLEQNECDPQQIESLSFAHDVYWSEPDLRVVEHLPNLQKIFLSGRPTHFEALYSLEHLVDLRIGYNPKAKMDISGIKSLRRLELRVERGTQSVFDCVQLEELVIDGGVTQKNAHRLRELENLKRLYLNPYGGTSLAGCLPPSLERFDLLRAIKLENDQYLFELPNLTRLRLQVVRGCSSFDFICCMPKLSWLGFDSVMDVDSFEPLRKATALKTFVISDPNKVNSNDVTPLLHLDLDRLYFPGMARVFTKEVFGKLDLADERYMGKMALKT